MSKHPRIFNQQPHSSPLSSSAASSSPVLDPFNNNYTLTGLVTHIDSSLGELIASKKSKEGKLELDRQSQVNTLSKIRDQVHVLKNIITYNLDQILNHLYQPSLKPQQDIRTNHSSALGSAKGDQPLDPSLAILDFQPTKKLQQRPHRRQQLSLSLPDSPSHLANPIFGSHSQPIKQQGQQVSKQKRDDTITPFELEEPIDNRMRIEDNNEREEDDEQDELFDLVCYEKDVQFSSNRVRERKNVREQAFSPILERAPEEEETLEKKKSTVQKGQAQITPRFQQSLSKKLFNYTASVLPRRVCHKKYNYLEQLNQRRS